MTPQKGLKNLLSYLAFISIGTKSGLKFKNTGFAIKITLIHSNFREIIGFESILSHPGSAC